MRLAKFPLLFCGLWMALSASAADRYREPNFDVRLFEADGLSWSDDEKAAAASQLVAVARNFPNDMTVSPRAKAMGLVLALHLVPEYPGALIGN